MGIATFCVWQSRSKFALADDAGSGLFVSPLLVRFRIGGSWLSNQILHLWLRPTCTSTEVVAHVIMHSQVPTSHRQTPDYLALLQTACNIVATHCFTVWLFHQTTWLLCFKSNPTRTLINLLFGEVQGSHSHLSTTRHNLFPWDLAVFMLTFPVVRYCSASWHFNLFWMTDYRMLLPRPIISHLSCWETFLSLFDDTIHKIQ